ncbi:MAG TPA: hypothetical protein VIF10_10525 [Methylobacter sp.]|jgi:hypothetical protein
METIVVRRDNERNIKFTGECIASVSSSDNKACSGYSGIVGRWTELAVYRTKAGKYICEQKDYTRWQGEQDSYQGAICESADQVVEFFGNDWLAKELYESAEIDDAVEVE